MHPAQDMATPVGSTVRAISSGKVIFAGWSTEGYGYKIEIRHWDGTISWYAHNSRLLVERVERRDPLVGREAELAAEHLTEQAGERPRFHGDAPVR